MNLGFQARILTLMYLGTYEIEIFDFVIPYICKKNIGR